MPMNRRSTIYFFLLMFLSVFVINIFPASGHSNSNIFFKKTKYCLENNLGWKFYCDDEISEEVQKPNDKKENINDGKSYIDELGKLREQLEETKAKAVLYPTEENVIYYMYLQKMMFDRASLFSDVWRRILWANPELDYTQKRPTSNLGKKVWFIDREKRAMETLRNVNKNYGIFFIYSTSCKFCAEYSKILLDFKRIHNIEIKGISIDGKFLPDWGKDSFTNDGQLEQLGIDYSIVPITVLFDTPNQTIIPVGYGLMTHDEIIERIYIITRTKLGEDY